MKDWIKIILITIAICIVIAIVSFASVFLLAYSPIGFGIIYAIISIFVIGYIVRKIVIGKQ